MRDRTNKNTDETVETNDAAGNTVAPELDDADDALVATLRALPPEGDEPDWKKLEAAIRAEVSPLAMPAPWWRNWRWLVPIGALATTAAIVMTIQLRRGDGSAATHRMTMRDASVPQEITDERAADERATDDEAGSERAAAMWLDGEPAELDEVPAEALDILDADPAAPLDGIDRLGPHDPLTFDERDDEARDDDARDDDDSFLGVLPASDYQWIDTLHDDEAARLETYLARKRS